MDRNEQKITREGVYVALSKLQQVYKLTGSYGLIWGFERGAMERDHL